MSNELDLPQVSIARYLELLQRRWWQVVPVTLFGLIAGAVVAFLFPRYYVAETVFTFKGGAVLDPRSKQDPMLEAATNARMSIPPLAERSMLELGWPEAVDEDDDRRRNFIKAVEGRIEVRTPFVALGMEQVNLTIIYKDTNGERAAAFANTLRDVWIDGERERKESKARAEKELLNQEVSTLEKLKRSTEASLRNHVELHKDVLHGLISNQTVTRKGDVETEHSGARERANIREKLATVAGDIARLEAEIDSLRSELDSANLKPTIIEIEPGAVDPMEEERFNQRTEEVEKAKQAVEALQPGRKRDYRQRIYEEAVKKLQIALEARTRSRRIEKDNPRYHEITGQLAERRSARTGAMALRAKLEERIDEIEAAIAQWPLIWRTYATLHSELESIKGQLVVANAEQRVAMMDFARLKHRRFRPLRSAKVPPRPTDPNIFLVAIIGSLVGLATAIGLILLLDFLQSAFKTVDDVERALPVPVLGTLAHLETDEERTYSVAQRRRVSLAAGVLLFLSLSVVTIYFFDPTKLPPPVMNLLDLLLGAPPPVPLPR